jgi:hypothetical protein
MSLPEYLKDDASFLQCSACGRKSWGGTEVNSVCGMPQPSSPPCSGIMRGKEIFTKPQNIAQPPEPKRG